VPPITFVPTQLMYFSCYEKTAEVPLSSSTVPTALYANIGRRDKAVDLAGYAFLSGRRCKWTRVLDRKSKELRQRRRTSPRTRLATARCSHLSSQWYAVKSRLQSGQTFVDLRDHSRLSCGEFERLASRRRRSQPIWHRDLSTVSLRSRLLRSCPR
jgi:hypothetical protein